MESKASETEREIREAQASIERELASATDSGRRLRRPSRERSRAGLTEEPSAASPQLELGIEETDRAGARAQGRLGRPRRDGNRHQETFLSHLIELRDRLVRCLLVVGVAFVPAFFFSAELYDLLARPVIASLPTARR